MSEKKAKEQRRIEESQKPIAQYNITLHKDGAVSLEGGPNNLVVFMDVINKAERIMLQSFGSAQMLAVANTAKKQTDEPKSNLIIPQSKIILPGH